MALNNFDWQAVLAKGKPAGYNGGPIVTDKNTVMTPELQAALDYNKALRYQRSAQKQADAAAQFGVTTDELRGAGPAYIPKDTSKIQPSQAALNDTSGFVIGGVNTPNMKGWYDKNPPKTSTSTGSGNTGGGSTGGGGVPPNTGTSPGGSTPPNTGGGLGPGGSVGGGTSSGGILSSEFRPGVTNWNVTPDQTVEGRMAGLMQQGNPLLERARTQALQGANERGILNSTMAAEAGTAALLDQARQIAGQDAATFAQSGQFNANAANQMADANATRSLSWSNAEADRALERAKVEYNGTLQRDLAKFDAQTRKELAVLDGDIRKQLAEVEAKFKTQMQNSQSASALYSDTVKSIATIMTDPKLDSGAKQNLINQLIGTTQQGLTLLSKIGSVDGLDEILAGLAPTDGGNTDGNTGGSTGGGGGDYPNPDDIGTGA